MAFYTVTYDLNKKKDYAKFEEGIRKVSSGKYIKGTLSQYVIQSQLNAQQINITLQAHSDNDDSILVLKLDVSDWSYTGLPDGLRSWLQKATDIG
ncbi:MULTISPECIES: hypothetical protein [Acinetobacter calcoaceticus/baumannii complex]|uniref:hypothetical protein n=1 Tax=Acinetobacter calcoaceticus/baumannii complex TaxID=909768 RepID=UPI000574CB55|nr:MULTISPECIES: hypothetical protein [Acinetobacter calcoaceticus/baumannii complex]KHO16737.1 hypothetical protein NT90_04055 [Acinetobacter baumannii]MBS0036384.1 hypothetical protein [Acinetobacter nosocomialis]TPU16073.1 hypothetical protein FJU87_16630 [Acinetobacter baumannii]